MNITGIVSNSANGGLTIGGSGSIELSGADSYSGNTTLGSGTLIVNNNTALGASTNILAAVNGTIESGSAAGITLTNPVQLNTGIQGLGVLTFTGANPLNLAAAITGFGGLTVNGTTSGPLTLSGSTGNTFIGDLIMDSGTLVLAKTGTTVATSAAIGSYGTVFINGGTVQQTGSLNEFDTSDSPNVTLSSTNAAQTLTFAGVGGTNCAYKRHLYFDFQQRHHGGRLPTARLPPLWNPIFKAALNVLSTVGGGNSYVTLPATGTNGNVTLMVEFCGALAGLPQGTMTPVFSSLLPSGSTVSAATAMINGVPAVGAHGTFALGANMAQFDTLTFVNGGDVTMTTGTLSFYDYSGCIQTIAEPLIPTAPVSASNPLLPSTAEISGGTTIITAYTNNGSFPVNIESSGGTLSNPSQAIALSGVTGGNFTLTFNSATTAPITYSSATATLASNIQAALNALTSFSSIATASVAVSGTTATVTFLNAAAGSIVPQLTANVAATNAIQNLTFPAGLTGGSFTLTFLAPGGTASTSTPITYSTVTTTLAANIQAALTSLGATTSLATVTATSATNVNISFQGADSGGVLTANSGVTAANGVGINQKQTIAFTNITGGTFELTYSITPGTTSTTSLITFSTSSTTLASNISNALNNLTSIGSGNVSVSASGTTATITFQGTLAALPETNLFKVVATSATPTIQNISFGGTPTNGGAFALTFVTPAGSTSTANVTYSTTTATLAANVQSALNTIDASVNAVQTLSFTGGPTGGTFSLGYGASTATGIGYSTSSATLASNIQAALIGLSTIGTGNVSVTASSASSVSITFQNTLGYQSISTPIVAGGTSA